MTEDDLINLQKLTGRSPQPWSLPPEDPDHILAAKAMLQLWPELARGLQPTPEALMHAEAVRALGPVGSSSPGAATTPQPYGAQSVGYGGASPAPDRPRQDPGAQYAMGSPVNVDQPWQTMADANTPSPPAPRSQLPPAAPPSAPSSVQTTIDPIPGYDETGNNAWRKANDQIFLDAVNRYNAENGYRPGDPGYWTADMLKAQAMVESGSKPQAFTTDPLQVNVGDWDGKKHTLAGLERHQLMTPQSSADAALKWLQYKGWVHDSTGKPTRYRGDALALRGYNGDVNPRSKYTKNPADTVEQRDWYAATVPQLARGRPR